MLTISIENLYIKKHAHIKLYLSNRKLKKNIIKIFKIGYIQKYNNIILLLIKNYRIFLIKKSGLLITKKEVQYIPFLGRIIFPITNKIGNTIGFGGRLPYYVIDKKKQKYLNSPESILFKKKFELYGLSNVRNQFNFFYSILIVEGYMDILSLWSNKYYEVISLLGTSMSLSQIKYILKYTNKIILCLDNDLAGKKATVKITTLFKKIKKTIINLLLPLNSDPNIYINESNINIFKKVLKNI